MSTLIKSVDVTGYVLVPTPEWYEIRQRLSNGQAGMLMGYCLRREQAEFICDAFNAIFTRRLTTHQLAAHSGGGRA